MRKVKATPYHIFLTGLFFISVGLPLSRTLITFGEIILAVGWLLSGDFKKKWSLFINNWPLLVFLMIYLMHVAGFFYSSDTTYAMKDLRIKAPLFVLPVLLATGPRINQKDINKVLIFFVGAVIASGVVSCWILFTQNPSETRQLSPFISHIRLSLMICLAVLITGYAIFNKEMKQKYRWLLGLLLLMLITYLFILEALTGIILFAILVPLVLIYAILYYKNTIFRIVTSLFIVLYVLAVVIFITGFMKELHPDISQQTKSLEFYTPQGNYYSHDTSGPINENGHLVWIYICEEELEEAWNQRSALAYDTTILNGYPISDVLIRYLSSKGLRKDAEGVQALSEEDIKNIEAGSTNYRYNNKLSIKPRLDQLKHEYWNYLQNNNPAGNSLLQRIELWRNARAIIAENMWFGVGTGDIKNAFSTQLENASSPLAGSKLRSHNQYYAIAIAFGIVGLIIFLFAIIFPVYRSKKYNAFIPMIFLLIAMLSMITEDTLESQVGATFFSFFYAFLFLRREEKQP